MNLVRFTQVEERIAELNLVNPNLPSGWNRQKRRIEQVASFYKDSEQYQKQGSGDTATHKLFIERGYDLLETEGRLAFVVPAGIYADHGTKQLRQMLWSDGNIQYMYNLSNERFFFPAVHHAFKFTLLGAQKGVSSDGFWATFRINPRVAVRPEELHEFLSLEENLIYVRIDSIERFSPSSLTVMEFETPEDYRIAETVYDEHPLLGEKNRQWNPRFTREFDMSGDSDLFNQAKMGLPLFEGKMIHQFDPHFAEPRYWVELQQGREKLSRKTKGRDWFTGFRFAWREVAGAVNERTLIATVLPPNTFIGHTLWSGRVPKPATMLYLVAMLNSFCIDWIARFKVNFHVTLTIMKQLPVPRLTMGNPYFDAIVQRAARLTCTTEAFAELWGQVMDEPWTESDGATEPAERQQLRDELDAIIAHLYGLSRDDFEHILGTFPLVFPDDDEGQMKKERLLAVYDEYAAQYAEE